MKSNKVLQELDIYSWILSEEIREAWKKEAPLPLLEQAGIIYPAYRSVEDKLQALRTLLAQAGTEEEREQLGKAAAYYETGIRQMRGEDTKSVGIVGGEQGERKLGEIWTAACLCCDMACGEYLGNLDYFVETHLFYSYKAAKEWAAQYIDTADCVCRVQKWECREEGLVEVMECSLRLVGDHFCATHVYIPDLEELEFAIQDHRLPYGLPFSTGELVKLEGAVFSEPLYGVWCGEECDGKWYNWMGYIKRKGEENEVLLTARNMGWHELGADELCVLDWLHPASLEELPDSQSLLGKISEEICQARESDGEKEAAGRFWEYFRIR